jgi:DNA-binding LytR/AlgR family response regulator
MLRAIAIDDEPIGLEVIRSLAEKVTFLRLEGCFINPFDAVPFLEPNNINLIFLDIEMPNEKGTDFIRTLPNPPMVIFTTAYSQHAVQSFELDAIDYLLKPFSLERFLKACNKAQQQLTLRKHASHRTNAIFIKSGYEQIKVDVNEILYAESDGNYIRFVTDKQRILSRLTMNEAEALLQGRDFLRVHRSFIIAKDKITKIEKRSLWIAHYEIPVGNGYLHDIEKILRE